MNTDEILKQAEIDQELGTPSEIDTDPLLIKLYQKIFLHERLIEQFEQQIDSVYSENQVFDIYREMINYSLRQIETVKNAIQLRSESNQLGTGH